MPLTGSYEPRPRWVTFFDDGQVFEDIPQAGLAAGQIKLDLYSYYRCADMDGLRLDGSWSGYEKRCLL